MANQNKVRRTIGTPNTQILAVTSNPVALSVIVSGDGVEVVDGRKVIKAGTPVGGAENTFENEQAVLTVVAEGSEDDIQGVLLHDVDVTRGNEDGTLLIFGFVNEYRLDDDVTISDAAKAALDGKVTFLRRNDMY